MKNTLHPRYFVLIYYNDHQANPVTDDDGFLLFYPSQEAIRNAVRHNQFASVLGYEIFCLGEGEI